MTIRLKKKIDSETLHLPELRQMIGKTVALTVDDGPAEKDLQTLSNESWNPPTLDELIRRQGTKPATSREDLLGNFTDEDFEGFDEWLEQTRRGPWRSEPVDLD